MISSSGGSSPSITCNSRRRKSKRAGEYDLEGLFLRLDAAISSIGAKRVVIDTLETLFGGLSNHAV